MQKKLVKMLTVVSVISMMVVPAFAAKKETNSAAYEQGLRLMQAGQRQEAVASFETAIKEYKNVAEAYKNIAIIKYTEGNIQDAIIALDKSLLEKPDAATYVLQASYYEEFGARKSAIRIINKAIDLEPTNPEHYLFRARLKEDIGDGNGAFFDKHFAEQLRAGNTDIVKGNKNSKVFKTYTTAPVNSKKLKSSDMIYTEYRK